MATHSTSIVVLLSQYNCCIILDTECNSSIMQSDSETTTSIVVKTLPTGN